MSMDQDWIAARDNLRNFLLDQFSFIEIVNPFPRLEKTNQAQRWLKFMQTKQIVDAWTIARTGVVSTFFTTCETKVLHQATIFYFLQHDDESESQDVFDSRIDQVMQALYPNLRLNQTVTLQGPAQLPEEDFRIFAGITCHYAEITTVLDQTVSK